MEYNFDTQEMMTRAIKYLIEAIVVGIVAAILPDTQLSFDKIVLISLTAAAMFSVLDLVAPSICAKPPQTK